MNFLQRNLFTKLRADNFGIKEEMEPMTTFKKKKIAQMLKNVNDVPAGEVKMNATPSIPLSRPFICCASSWQT